MACVTQKLILRAPRTMTFSLRDPQPARIRTLMEYHFNHRMKFLAIDWSETKGLPLRNRPLTTSALDYVRLSGAPRFIGPTYLELAHDLTGFTRPPFMQRFPPS